MVRVSKALCCWSKPSPCLSKRELTHIGSYDSKFLKDLKKMKSAIKIMNLGIQVITPNTIIV